MKVVSVTDYLCNVGGAELSAQTILSGIADHPQVDSLTVIGIDHPKYNRLDFGTSDVVSVDLPTSVFAAPDLFGDAIIERALARQVDQVVDEGHVDVVHAHHRRSTLALSRLNLSSPSVATIRDFWPICPISVYDLGGEQCSGCDGNLATCVVNQGWTGVSAAGVKPYLLMKRLHQCGRLDEVDCTVFIAEHLRTTIEANISSRQSEVVYNPIRLDHTGSVEHDESESATFVTASSLTQEKGVDTAIRAMGRLEENNPNARLIIFGDGPLDTELRSLAERKCSPETINFRGRVSPECVYDTINRSTATIFPSRWAEPFGRITVESMMLETPVVGTDVGGIGEIVENGSNGLLFPVGDDDILADHLQRLCANPSLRSRLIEGGRTTARRFSPERIVNEHLALYKTLTES